MPWLRDGTRFGTGDQDNVNFLQRVLPEFLVGSLNEIVLGFILFGVLIYLFMIGDFIYSRRAPTHLASIITFDFLAGTCYVSASGRLLYIANNLGAEREFSRAVSMLAFFAFTTTATYVVTLRGGRAAGGADVRFLPRWQARIPPRRLPRPPPRPQPTPSASAP